MPSAQESWEWAADFCERTGLFDPPKVTMSHSSAGWKPPTPEEKINAIRQVALAVTDTDDATWPASDCPPLIRQAIARIDALSVGLNNETDRLEFDKNMVHLRVFAGLDVS